MDPFRGPENIGPAAENSIAEADGLGLRRLDAFRDLGVSRRHSSTGERGSGVRMIAPTPAM